MESQDQIEAALKEFEGDYDTEELRLIKFISEVAN
jgi:ATP-dependent DNA helicase RecQ